MTIQSQTSRISYAGDGVTKQFPVPWKFFADTDIQAFSISSTGAVAQLNLNVDFTLTGAGSASGGTLTTTAAAALASGATITIYLDPPRTQLSIYESNDSFPAKTAEANWDRSVQMVQRVADMLSRSVRMPDSDDVATPVLPSRAARKGLALICDPVTGLVTVGIPSTQTITANSMGQLTNPQTQAELNAGITPTNYASGAGNAIRYNIVPNQTGSASANLAALKAYCDPTKTNGPTGVLYFPPIIGGDTYHFNDMMQIRPGMRWDLMGCTLKFTKPAYASADDYQAFLTMISNVVIENGKIQIDYPGGGTGGGQVMRIGSRNGYAFGTFTSGVFDLDNSVNQGDIILRNIEVVTNNPNAYAAIVMLGGLSNVLFENVKIDGQNLAQCGIYYEFGWATKNGSGAQQRWSSSHMHNATFRNIKVSNLATGGSDGCGIEFAGAYDCLLENIKVTTAKNGVRMRMGEALFFRTWPGVDDNGGKRCITLRNIVAQGITSTGIALIGAESAQSGYLNDAAMTGQGLAVLTASQQVDLMSYSLDGFAVSAAGSGVQVSGPCDIRNGHIKGGTSSGGVILTDDCIEFDVNLVRIEGSAAEGIRANFAGIAAWSGTPRLKIGQIRNCLIAGGSSVGIGIGNSRAIRIDNNRIGYSTAYDSTGDEATQTIGISLQSTASGCNMVENFITTSGGNLAYSSLGSGDRGNNIERPKGLATATGGAFLLDGVAQASNAALADKTNAINTANKYAGKVVNNTSNTYWMVAQGAADVSPWKVVDNSVTLTPA